MAQGLGDGGDDLVGGVGVGEPDGLWIARFVDDQKGDSGLSQGFEFVPAEGGHGGEVGGHGDDGWAEEEGFDGIAVEDFGFEGLAVEAPFGGEVEDDDLA